jgi:hypothetical protein
LFALTVLVYPLALALLCLGAGLLIDRCSDRFLPAALLPSVGVAALIALSQLSTYFSAIAPATPYLIGAFALAGFPLGAARLRRLLASARTQRQAVAIAPIAYLLAIAPVLLAGRASFSSFMALSDSAVHMIGADFLIHHGQDYAHLDLRNSYGQFINDYYGTGYPSGADTLLGGSGLLLGLPLIWAFQPFVAFMLAVATGPAWLLARRLGLVGSAAAAAALVATLPALVYGYELIGSIKEIASISMILLLGALVQLHGDWLARAPHRALPFALALAAGVSALGAGFGAWGLAATLVLLALLVAGRSRAAPRLARRSVRERSAERRPHGDSSAPGRHRDRYAVRPVLATTLVGTIVLLVAAWPTWRHISSSLHVAQAIASTGNAGNLSTPLKWTQVFGLWLRGSYKQAPVGAALVATDVLIVLAFCACLIGALTLARARAAAMLGWIAAMLLVWLVLDHAATTWVEAKALVLSSPVVVLLACAGAGTIARAARSRPARALATALALALVGGVLVSDALQYHSSNLAPTARYEELASINKRFAGRGPVLFTDFDEYSMYVLRDLDVGGPDFVYPPPALASLAGGYGRPVRLDSAAPRALRAYPLIVTRRDPSASRPPAAYRLAWHGAYYDVWARRAVAPAALAHVASSTARPLACARVQRLVRTARAGGLAALAAPEPAIVRVRLRHASHPRGWGRTHGGFAMQHPGTLSVAFELPRAGAWQLWLQGQFMPSIDVEVDGRRLASLAGQLAGNSLVPDTAGPLDVRLADGRHRLRVTRRGFSLAPGNGGAAVLDDAFLTPAVAPAAVAPQRLELDAAPHALCARPYQWIELVRR